MTNATRRLPDYAGHRSPKSLPKGPNGLPLCRWCKTTECASVRRTFCSEACIHEHKIRTQPQYAKAQVAKRDDCRCAICGTDTFAELRASLGARKDLRPVSLLRLKCTTFDMDHTVPVCEGGGSCGLDGLRTLCRPCHRVVTAQLAARRAEARRKAKAGAA